MFQLFLEYKTFVLFSDFNSIFNYKLMQIHALNHVFFLITLQYNINTCVHLLFLLDITVILDLAFNIRLTFNPYNYSYCICHFGRDKFHFWIKSRNKIYKYNTCLVVFIIKNLLTLIPSLRGFVHHVFEHACAWRNYVLCIMIVKVDFHSARSTFSAHFLLNCSN